MRKHDAKSWKLHTPQSRVGGTARRSARAWVSGRGTGIKANIQWFGEYALLIGLKISQSVVRE